VAKNSIGMHMNSLRFLILISAALVLAGQNRLRSASQPGSRVLLDAHNCYPYSGWWTDRIDRALSTGTPLAIEQDLYWYKDSRTGRAWSILSHGEPITGSEPQMKEYFFERIRPIVEKALKDNDVQNWPLITLNLDFKTEEPEHLKAAWNLLSEYRDWITTAPRTSDTASVAPLRIRPLLVLTGDSDAQKAVFYDQVLPGSDLLVFGASPVYLQDPQAPPSTLVPATADNYHRWWNNPWRVIESGGQNAAGDWTEQKELRLRDLVRYAHEHGFWIRFYTLDGSSPDEESARGTFHNYNFGSLDAVRQRWRAAIRAGVDYLATDQYEQFARELYGDAPRPPIVITGTLTHADYESLFERQFDVAPGTKSLRIALAYTGEERKTVIDLGLRGPEGFRGWSGGGPQKIVVGATFASYGYLPGPIEPGRWGVVLGVPNIREASNDSYTISIEELDHEEPALPVIRREPGWFAGDFHSHSGHSDGRANLAGGAQVKLPPYRVFDAARQGNLDFIALTDHNTTSHWTEIERLQPYYSNLLLMHAREVTTYNGHMNAFGERSFVDFRITGQRSLHAVLDELAAGGAFVSINHPAAPDDETCMGCGWSARDLGTMRQVNGIEIVNGDNVEGPLAGWPLWADMLNAGLHLTAIGGSDDHTADEARDRAVGRPTTMVYAEELSEPALLDGLRKGRVYIRTRGVSGPALQFEATSNGQSWQMGATIPKLAATEIVLSATVSRAAGQQIQWIRNGQVMSTVPAVNDRRVLLPAQAHPGDWFSLILRDRKGPTVFSNAIYIE
jgi:hypothetical protein